MQIQSHNTKHCQQKSSKAVSVTMPKALRSTGCAQVVRRQTGHCATGRRWRSEASTSRSGLHCGHRGYRKSHRKFGDHMYCTELHEHSLLPGAAN